MERLLRLSEASRNLSISRGHLYKLIRSGDIPLVHLGRSSRIRQASLDRFIEGLESQAPEGRIGRVA